MIEAKKPSNPNRNHKQELTEALVLTLEKLNKDQQLYFIAGYLCPSLGLLPQPTNLVQLQRIVSLVSASVSDGLISFTNFVEILVEAGLAGRRDDRSSQQVCQKFEQQVQALCGELACSRKYLREKWFKECKYHGGKQVDSEEDSLKLIRQLQEEDQREQQKRRMQMEKESEKFLGELLKREEEEKERQRQQRQQKIMEMEKANMVCQICAEEIPYTEVGTLSCSHIFHKGCIRGHIEALVIEKKVEIPCPAGCGKNLSLEDIQEYIDGQLKEKFDKFCFDLFVEKNDKFVSWCPTPGCTAVFSHEGDLDNYRCPVCKKHYCLSCRCEYHRGQTCAEYRISHSYGEDDRKFQDFVRGAKFKQCPKCKFWVERIEGCSSMACRCGHEFCYDCGGSDCPHGMCKNKGPDGVIGGLGGIFRGGRRR